jgi:Protein of unknown function (DUF1153)
VSVLAMSTGRSVKRPSIDFGSYLPPAGWRTWGVRNKAAVVIAIRSGTLSRVDAYERYMLSEEELSGWEEAFDQDGLAGLQATRR